MEMGRTLLKDVYWEEEVIVALLALLVFEDWAGLSLPWKSVFQKCTKATQNLGSGVLCCVVD